MRTEKVADVMTTDVITAREDTSFKELARLMREHRLSGLPVVDERFHLVGIVTEADLLLAEEGEPKLRSDYVGWYVHPKRLAALRARAAEVRATDIMTRHVVAVRSDDTIHDAAKVLLDAGVRRLPVVDDDRLVGIVSRRDLLRPYQRADEEIRADIRDELSKTMWIDPAAVDVRVEDGVARLEGRVEGKALAELLVERVRHTDGVVGVDDQLTVEPGELARVPEEGRRAT